MLGFTIIWIGQMLSLLGTNLTGFALTIWAWEVTGQATALALVGFFAFAPVVLVSPIAGAIIDRYDRKRIMQLADLAAGLPTVAVLLIYTTGHLQIWHLFVTGMISGTFQAFHFPAYSAAVTMMLRKEHYARASGMISTAQFVATVFAPLVAAILMGIIGIAGIMMIDITTFITAITMLFFIHIPRPPASDAGRKGMGSIWKESLYGFRYIYERPSLLGLQLTFFCVNLIGTFGNILLAPMILARTANDTVLLGSVMSIGGIGGLVGSILLTLWGGPKRRVHGVLFGMILLSIFGQFLIGLGREFYLWTLATFLGLLVLPVINGSSQAIWQAKVAPDIQGRVFATRLLVAQVSVPVAMLMAGPLADRVFEPMMKNGSPVPLFDWLVGTGPGAGMSLMFVITGLIGAIIGLVAYSIRTVRNAEDILPDRGVGATQSNESETGQE